MLKNIFLIGIFLIIQSCTTTEKIKNHSNENGLSKEQIADTIYSNIKDINSCYEIGLKENSQLSGRFVASFKIDSKGYVKLPLIVDSTLGSKNTESCVISKLSSWQFPVPVGGEEVTVKYPFKLERK